MSPEEIYAALNYPLGRFPEEAFAEAFRRPDEMKPIFLAELKKAWSKGPAGEINEDDFGHYYALLLLAKWGAQELYPMLIEFLGSSNSDLDDTFCDTWPEDFAAYLTACYNGDSDSLLRIARDFSLDESQCAVAAQGLFNLLIQGKIERAPVIEALILQLTDAGHSSRSLRINAACSLLILCPIESETLLRETGLFSNAEINEHLELGIDACTPQYQARHSVEAIVLIEAAFRRWAFVKPERARPSQAKAPNILHAAPAKASAKPKTPAFQPPPPPKPKAPVNQDERLISRNAPCPCGSGKIYKKCCAKN